MVCIGNGYLHYYKRNFYQVKLIAVSFLALLFACKTIAQTHNEFWSKLSFTKSINTKWSGVVDFNFRQQANYQFANKNNFDLPLMRSIRLWLFYNLDKKYSLVGSFFIAKTAEVKNAKGDLSNASETQYNFGLLRKDNFKKMVFRNRLLAEIRTIKPQTGNDIRMYRYRFQNNLTIELKELAKHSVLNTVVNNELFLKIQDKVTGFDQDRIYCMMQWHLHNVEYNIGFQKTLQNQHNELVKRNQFLLNVNVYL